MTDLRLASAILAEMESTSSLLPTDVDMDSQRPDIGRPALAELREACELPNDLFGGNRAMRKRARRWLPQEAQETETNYRIRVERTTCFPFYRDTLCDLAARPFSRAIMLGGDPKAINLDKFLANMDGEGRDLTGWSREVLLHAIHRGMDHVLVDSSSGSGATVAATDARRIYARRIDALSMLDIRDQADESGNRFVVYCRFVTTRVTDNDEFTPQTEVVIVELEHNPGSDKAGKRTEWKFDKETRRWFVDTTTEYNPGKRGIPLFTIYTQQTGPYSSEPLLEDLAWVNLAHYQSRSDHAHVMRIARLITLVTLGFRENDRGDTSIASKGASSEKIVLGPLSRINSPKSPSEVSVSFLEPSGVSIDLSFRDMDQLADECKRLGARHHTSKTGNVTARSIISDDKKSNTNLATFVGRLEVLIRQVIEAAAEWSNVVAVPQDIVARIHKDFASEGNSEAGARALASLASVLSPRQLLIEAVRYGILRPDFPVDDNLRELKEAQSALDAAIAAQAGTPGGHEHPPDPDGEDDMDEGPASEEEEVDE